MSRKFTAAISIAFLFLFQNLSGQMRFGVIAEPQLSWFNSDTKVFKANDPVMGLNFGFNAEKFFADRYAFVTGLTINSLGGNLKYMESGYQLVTRDSTYNITEGTNVKFKGQYLCFPLGLKFKTNEIGYMTFYAHLGLTGNIRLKGYAWQDEHNIEKETATEQITVAFASYHIGAGMEYSLGGPSAIMIGLVYSGGLTESYEAGFGKVTTSGLSLRIGILF